ncbi:MAG: hypothetical protein HG423_003585 [Propionibacterium sp.]|nr:hypothetical protein [Propionibacterium sp.]
MVAPLIAVRLRSQLSALRSSPWAMVGYILLVLMLLPLFVGLTVGLSYLRFLPDVRSPLMLTAGAVLVLVWTFGSVLFFAMDDSVSPQRLVLFPLRSRDLLVPLLVSDLLTLPGVFTLLVCCGFMIGWATDPLLTITGIASTALGVVTGMLAGRILVTSLSRWLAARRSRDLLYVVLLLGLIAISWGGPLLSRGMFNLDLNREAIELVGDAAGWSPMGWAWSLPADLAAGRSVVAALRLSLALVLLAAMIWLWSRQLDRALTSPLPSAGGGAPTVSSPWLDRLFPPNPAGAIAARNLRYLRRDPRRFASVLVIMATPFFVVFMNMVRDEKLIPEFLWLVAALATWMGGISALQDTPMDGSALWLHAVSGIRGFEDRLGRLMANSLIYGGTFAMTMVLASPLLGAWGVFPFAFGLGLGTLIANQGMSLLISSFLNGTAPPPGTNPFASTSKGQGAAFLASVLQMIGSAILLLPAAGMAFASYRFPLLGWLFLPVGPVLGLLAALGLISLGGRQLDRTWPEVLKAVTYEK